MLTVGVINNMAATAERRFEEILTSAAGKDVQLRIQWYRLTGSQPEHYSRIENLWDQDLDGLIVTGSEPKAVSLNDEPFWRSFVKTVDWARHRTSSTIWSCLAAHAAVLHLDGIERYPSDPKIFGLFKSVRSENHEILADTEPVWHVPHSRWNDLSESDLAIRGYTVLARSEAAGVDTFIKQFDRSLFVFIQSHPEYDADTLVREYNRDVMRFHVGLQSRYPDAPRNYFDSRITAELEAMRYDPVGGEKGQELLGQMQVENSWRPMVIQLYRNWLNYLVTQSRAVARQSV